jgi:hypothetical protein
MEMVVVMLLSAIVISIAFQSFDILTKNYLLYKNNAAMLARTALLDRLLTLDFIRCSYVKKTQEGIVFGFEDRTIEYISGSGYITRQQDGQTDTFAVNTAPMTCKFQHQERTHPGNLVDELEFRHEYKGEALYFHYRKIYGADVLMEEERTPRDDN